MIESLIIGIKSLNYSASLFETEEEEESKFDKWFDRTFKDKGQDIILGISLIISLGFATLLFFILPTFLTSMAKNYIKDSSLILNIVERSNKSSYILCIYCGNRKNERYTTSLYVSWSRT